MSLQVDRSKQAIDGKGRTGAKWILLGTARAQSCAPALVGAAGDDQSPMHDLINAQFVRHRAAEEDINMLDPSSQIRLTHCMSWDSGCVVGV